MDRVDAAITSGADPSFRPAPYRNERCAKELASKMIKSVSRWMDNFVPEPSTFANNICREQGDLDGVDAAIDSGADPSLDT